MTGLPLVLYDNRFADAAPVASSTAAGDYAAANVADWRPYTWWMPSVIPASIDVDCGSPRAADYFAMYGHNLGTVLAGVEVSCSDDAFISDIRVVLNFSVTDDRPIIRTFATQTARYWRFWYTGAAPAAIAILAVGTRLTLPRRLRAGFDPTGRTPQGKFNRSIKGQPLGSVIDFEEWSELLRLRSVTWDWVRDSWQPAWVAHLKSKPWLFAWDPTDHASELYLVDSSRGYKTPISTGTFADLEVQISGVAP